MQPDGPHNRTWKQHQIWGKFSWEGEKVEKRTEYTIPESTTEEEEEEERQGGRMKTKLVTITAGIWTYASLYISILAVNITGIYAHS